MERFWPVTPIRMLFHDYHGFLNLWTGHLVIERSWTGNRHGFMGRNGTLRRPAGLARVSLDKLTGSSYNPCGAIQLKISLEANEEAVVYILVGAAQSRETAQKYLKQYSEADTVLQSRTEVLNFWQDTLGQVEVATPDQGFDFLINRWLIYQTLVCRFWARSAFYQSGELTVIGINCRTVWHYCIPGRIWLVSRFFPRCPSVPGRRCATLVA